MKYHLPFSAHGLDTCVYMPVKLRELKANVENKVVPLLYLLMFQSHHLDIKNSGCGFFLVKT